jgi:hypothetical protein
MCYSTGQEIPYFYGTQRFIAILQKAVTGTYPKTAESS